MTKYVDVVLRTAGYHLKLHDIPLVLQSHNCVQQVCGRHL